MPLQDFFVEYAEGEKQAEMLDCPVGTLTFRPSLAGQLTVTIEPLCTYAEGTKVQITFSHSGTADIKDLRQDIKELRQGFTDLRQEFHELTLVVQRLSFDIHRIQENEAHEREKMALRLENEILRFERRLPPAKPGSGQDAG